MAAHNTVLNKPCHANSYLVNTILRVLFDIFVILGCIPDALLRSDAPLPPRPNTACAGLLSCPVVMAC